MRVLVTGDRNWDDANAVFLLLSGLEVGNGHLTIIEGGQAKLDATGQPIGGADYFAAQWAKDSDSYATHEPYEADWDMYSKAAGPIRNRQMLNEGKPDLVLAFHDDISKSKGTKDMITIAKAAGVPVYLVSRP